MNKYTMTIQFEIQYKINDNWFVAHEKYIEVKLFSGLM